eukprot:8167745-Pyramimonas_sp.AAC.1
MGLESGIPFSKVRHSMSDLPGVSQGGPPVPGGHDSRSVVDSAGGMGRSVWPEQVDSGSSARGPQGHPRSARPRRRGLRRGRSGGGGGSG